MSHLVNALEHKRRDDTVTYSGWKFEFDRNKFGAETVLPKATRRNAAVKKILVDSEEKANIVGSITHFLFYEHLDLHRTTFGLSSHPGQHMIKNHVAVSIFVTSSRFLLRCNCFGNGPHCVCRNLLC